MKNPPSWFAPAVAIGSAVLTLYAIEAAFTFASPDSVDRIGLTLRKGPSVVAETWRLRQRGIKAYPYLQSDVFWSDLQHGISLGDGSTVLPLAGIPNVMTVLCNESGTTIGYRSDTFGFRSAPDTWNSSAGLFIIGDSFAHGFCRTERETIAGQLRGRGWAVANAGYTGAGPLSELGIIREYVSFERPRKVFWLFYEGNDLIDLDSERATMLMSYLQPAFSQRLREKSKGIAAAQIHYADSVVNRYEPPGLGSAIRGFLSFRSLRTSTGLYRGVSPHGFRDEKNEIELLKKVLASASGELHASGAELYLVYLPERRRFNSRLIPTIGENHNPVAIEKAVLQVARELRVPVLNAATEFGSTKDPAKLWKARRYHYSAEGYRIVADLISRAATATPKQRR